MKTDISSKDVLSFARSVAEDSGTKESLAQWDSVPSLQAVKQYRSVAAFGEGFVRGWLRNEGYDVRDRRNAQHDLQVRMEEFGELQQWEVKTSFLSRLKTHWFNQIGPRTKGGGNKDFSHLCFVFVNPDNVQMWYAVANQELFDELTENNGYDWKGKGAWELSDKWTCLCSINIEKEVQ